jgi:hypothetical protein
MKKIYTLTKFDLNNCELDTYVFSSEQEAWDKINKTDWLDKEVNNQDELDQVLDETAVEGEDPIWIEIQEHEINF